MQALHYASRTLALAAIAAPAAAQVVPDGSLPTEVRRNGAIVEIVGGSRAGDNLFHSFREFSVPTGGEVRFDNVPDVARIFSRVTGGSVSDIDGLLRANGSASLFLLNPAGIVFGPNARLDLGGSFYATTAEQVTFADGRSFGAIAPTAEPLLSVSVPVGLQFGTRSGAIAATGLGRGADATAQLSPRGSALALLGRSLDLDGALLSVEAGHLELGGVAAGTVALNPADIGRPLDYSGVAQFGPVTLRGRALTRTRNPVEREGGLALVGDRLRLADGALALVETTDVGRGGLLRLRGSELLAEGGGRAIARLAAGGSGLGPRLEARIDRAIVLRGIDPLAPTDGSGLLSEIRGAGHGGDLRIDARSLSLQDGGQAATLAIVEEAPGQPARTGALQATIGDNLEVTGANPAVPELFSTLGSVTASAADAGDVWVVAGRVGVRDGGSIQSATLPFIPGISEGLPGAGSGNGGNLTVTAREAIAVSGSTPQTFSSSFISTFTNGTGQAGDLTILTPQLTVSAGGQVNSTTSATGDAGRVTIAADAVRVSGREATGEPSEISSSAFQASALLQDLFRLPPEPTGNTNRLTLIADRLEINDGGTVTAEHDGPGNGGDVEIAVRQLVLTDGGRLSVSTRSGNGGNLFVRADATLVARGGSRLDAAATGAGDGGNARFEAQAIALLDGSTISANAIAGDGGNIDIATRALLVSPDSAITASSQFGLSGTVDIGEIETETDSLLVPLPETPLNPAQQIATGCNATGSRFVATGRGGLPDAYVTGSPWADLRADLGESDRTSSPVSTSTSPVEATAIAVDGVGNPVLVAGSSLRWRPGTCPGRSLTTPTGDR